MIPVERKGYVCGGILVVVILVLVAANLLLGSVDIPAGAVWGALTGGTVENEAWSFIVWESRVPLCVTAWCCGAALAASASASSRRTASSFSRCSWFDVSI